MCELPLPDYGVLPHIYSLTRDAEACQNEPPRETGMKTENTHTHTQRNSDFSRQRWGDQVALHQSIKSCRISESQSTRSSSSLRKGLEAVTVFHKISLNLARMQTVISFDARDGQVIQIPSTFLLKYNAGNYFRQCLSHLEWRHPNELFVKEACCSKSLHQVPSLPHLGLLGFQGVSIITYPQQPHLADLASATYKKYTFFLH